MSTDDEVVALLRRMDALRIQIDRATSTKAERQEYAALRRRVEALLGMSEWQAA